MSMPTLQRSSCGGIATFTNRCVQGRPVVSPYGRWSVPALTDSQRYPGGSGRAHGAFLGGAAGCPWEPQRAARNRREAQGSAGSRRELLEAVGSHPTGAAGNRWQLPEAVIAVGSRQRLQGTASSGWGPQGVPGRRQEARRPLGAARYFLVACESQSFSVPGGGPELHYGNPGTHTPPK